MDTLQQENQSPSTAPADEVAMDPQSAGAHSPETPTGNTKGAKGAGSPEEALERITSQSEIDDAVEALLARQDAPKEKSKFPEAAATDAPDFSREFDDDPGSAVEAPAPDGSDQADPTDLAEEEEPDGDGSKPVARKVKVQSQLDHEVVSIKQRNPDMSWADADALARRNLGIAQPAEPKPQESADAPEPETAPEQKKSAFEEHFDFDAHAEAMRDNDLEMVSPSSVEDVGDHIARLRIERSKARRALDVEKEATIDDEILRLENEGAKIQREQNAFIDAWNATEQKLTEQFSDYDYGHPDAEITKRVRALEAEAKATNDPIYYSPHRREFLAAKAAMELRVVPKSAPSKPRSVPMPSQVKPAPAPVASGAAQTATNTPGRNQQDEANRYVQSLGVDDLEDILHTI